MYFRVRCKFVEIAEADSLEIDTHIDLSIAEILYSNRYRELQ